MTTVKKSLNELSISKKRLAELEAIQDKDINYSDIPELDEQFWKNAEVRLPENKKSVNIRLDADVLEWMKAQGKGYQSRINAILRSYYEAHKNEHTNHL
ncbi:MAG: 3-oxoacyl-ACP synthase [Methylomarinum sp.]|nr:3-oxoacyl-ACP synthase [Methylomarinum sp.]